MSNRPQGRQTEKSLRYSHEYSQMHGHVTDLFDIIYTMLALGQVYANYFILSS